MKKKKKERKTKKERQKERELARDEQGRKENGATQNRYNSKKSKRLKHYHVNYPS